MYSAYIVGSLRHMLQILDVDLLCVCKEPHTSTIFSMMVQNSVYNHCKHRTDTRSVYIEVFVCTRYGSRVLYVFTPACGDLEYRMIWWESIVIFLRDIFFIQVLVAISFEDCYYTS